MKGGTRRLETKTKQQQYYDGDDDGTTERDPDNSLPKQGLHYGSDSEDDMQFGRIASGNNRQRLISGDSDDLNSIDSKRITTFINPNAFGDDEPDSYDPRRETTNIIK